MLNLKTSLWRKELSFKKKAIVSLVSSHTFPIIKAEFIEQKNLCRKEMKIWTLSTPFVLKVFVYIFKSMMMSVSI